MPILAQRMPFKAVPQEDAFQVGVPCEAHAKHIPDFPLLEVGRRPDRRQAWHLGIFSIWNPDLERDARPLQIGSRGVEVVDYFNAVGIVGCGEVGEVIEPHLVAQMDRRGLELAGIQN